MSALRVELLPINRLNEVEPAWESILAGLQDGVCGPDATCGPYWTSALAQTLLSQRKVQFAVAFSGPEPVAVLPYYRADSESRLQLGELRSVLSAYGGRAEILARDRNEDHIRGLLLGLMEREPAWGTLTVRVVAGAQGHQALLRTIAGAGLKCAEVERERSLYMELPGRWEDLAARIHQKLRHRIRKGERDLEKAGTVEYREFTTPADCESFLSVLAQVEARSWKDAAGVSILANDYQQQFYRAMVPVAAAAGVLSAHALVLDGTPIAYMMGLLGREHVFLALKSSFDEGLSGLSPGHVLKRLAIARLIERGATIFDFMGACDPHKLRWTDRTYEVLTLAIYNRSIRGTLASLRRRAAALRKTSETQKVLPSRAER